MEIIYGLVGALITWVVLQLLGEILIGLPGYFIYCALSTKREFDREHWRERDHDSAWVPVLGVAFWVAVLGIPYAIYSMAK